MIKYGIDTSVWDRIVSVLKADERIEDIILFGSRAKGNYKPGSDIDLAIKAKGLALRDILRMSVKLDELDVPWEIQLVDYNSIRDEGFISIIDRTGISLLA